MTFSEWLKEQREIESKATKGTWQFSSYYKDEIKQSTLDELNSGEGELKSSEGTSIIQSWDYEGYASGIYIRPEDAIKIENDCNNYRNMLDALEIAMNGLEHFCDCVSPYAGACGNCTATIKIKQKLGVE